MHDLHTSFSAWSNWKSGLRGHLWQGRFYSCALDDHHLIAATRYVETNPVRAGLAKTASEYLWSSAIARCGIGRSFSFLGELPGILKLVGDWDAFLRSEPDPDVDEIRASTRTGRPCGSREFCQDLEAKTGRQIIPYSC